MYDFMGANEKSEITRIGYKCIIYVITAHLRFIYELIIEHVGIIQNNPVQFMF